MAAAAAPAGGGAGGQAWMQHMQHAEINILFRLNGPGGGLEWAAARSLAEHELLVNTQGFRVGLYPSLWASMAPMGRTANLGQSNAMLVRGCNTWRSQSLLRCCDAAEFVLFHHADQLVVAAAVVAAAVVAAAVVAAVLCSSAGHDHSRAAACAHAEAVHA
jgi:hypothetical protein